MKTKLHKKYQSGGKVVTIDSSKKGTIKKDTSSFKLNINEATNKLKTIADKKIQASPIPRKKCGGKIKSKKK